MDGPPVRIRDLLADVPVHVSRDCRPVADGGMVNDGVLFRVPSGYHYIIVNGRMPITRQRFTVAHELGHIAHDHDCGYALFHVATHYADGPEREANEWAAERLMPEPWVRRLWQERTNLCWLAERFRVSAQAMNLRLRALGLTGAEWKETAD